MLYDISAKKAQRLLGKNFQAVMVEAHRLAGLAIPTLQVEVFSDSVRLSAGQNQQNGYWEYVSLICSDGSIEGDTPATVLQKALVEAQRQADCMGEVAQEMAAIK